MDSMNEVFESVARYFALLSEPTRLRIMHSICQQEKSVNQIVEELGASQTNVSRHLGLMYQAGVLARRKDGNQVLYHVTDTAFTEICRTVCVRVASELDGDKTLKRSFKNLIDELG
jgi:DNA-binding transcriptional ArsR family regulator